MIGTGCTGSCKSNDHDGPMFDMKIVLNTNIHHYIYKQLKNMNPLQYKGSKDEHPPPRVVLDSSVLVPGRFAPNHVHHLSRFAPNIPFTPWVVSPRFINSALKNEIWKIPLQIFVKFLWTIHTVWYRFRFSRKIPINDIF